MKNTIQALSLAMALASPFTMSLTAIAQEEITRPAIVQQVAQTDKELDSFFSSDYDYWDARVLGNFWGMNLTESKAYIGRKLIWGGESKAYLQQNLLDARLKALANADSLKLFYDAGLGYEDAAKLAEFWGDPNPWESKLRIERNLILGDYDVVMNALRMAK